MFKNIIQMIRKILIVELVLLFTVIIYFPDQVSGLVGYRFYTVYTDSMEPTIPTYSLVLSRLIPEDEAIEPNTIVTFEANRFGDDILLTHYFRETQYGDDGNLYYRTQAEGVDNYDAYETKRSDIIGKYVAHVPFIGKVFLFLKSPFGFIFYGEMAVIMLINKLIRTKWEEKEKLQLTE